MTVQELYDLICNFPPEAEVWLHINSVGSNLEKLGSVSIAHGYPEDENYPKNDKDLVLENE